jgi:hypothetical protein
MFKQRPETEISTALMNSVHRKLRWWALPPIILGCCISLLKYLGATATYSALYGIPSQAETVRSSGRWGAIYFWIFLVFFATSTVLTIVLLRKDVGVEGADWLRYTIRLIAAVLINALVVGIGTLILATLGRFLT